MKDTTMYEEMVQEMVESCYDSETKTFDWEAYQSFCDSAEESGWWDD